MDNVEKHAEAIVLGYFKFIEHSKRVELKMEVDDKGNVSSTYIIEHDMDGVRNPLEIPIKVETSALKRMTEV